MALTINDTIQNNSGKPIDAKYGIFASGSFRPYTSTTEANTTVNSAYRSIGLTVLVGTQEYWYRDGVADGNLIVKTPGSGTVSSISTGSLSPLFAASIASPTTTPALSFSLSATSANTIFGNNTGSVAAPVYFSPLLSSTLFANQGTTTTVLHGNAAGSPAWGAVSLATDVAGNLPVSNLNSGTAATSATFWRGDGTWGTPAGSGSTLGSVTYSSNTVAGLSDLDKMVFLNSTSGNITYTLTPSTFSGRLINLYAISPANTASLVLTSGTINGISTYDLTNGESITVYSDGTNLLIKSRN